VEQPTGQVTEIARELFLAEAQEKAALESIERELRDSNAEAMDGRGSISHISSTIPATTTDNQSRARTNLNSEMLVESTKSKSIDKGEEREVEAVVKKPS